MKEIEVLELKRHFDDRGYFEEVLKSSQIDTQFGQLSHSMMVTGTIKAWHVHTLQSDWWFVPVGIIKAVVCDLTSGWKEGNIEPTEFQEFILGDNQESKVIKIPPGWAHGLKVLQGPAHLFYITDREYDPEDEGRIDFDLLGYDWMYQKIT